MAINDVGWCEKRVKCRRRYFFSYLVPFFISCARQFCEWWILSILFLWRNLVNNMDYEMIFIACVYVVYQIDFCQSKIKKTTQTFDYERDLECTSHSFHLTSLCKFNIFCIFLCVFDFYSFVSEAANGALYRLISTNS